MTSKLNVTLNILQNLRDTQNCSNFKVLRLIGLMEYFFFEMNNFENLNIAVPAQAT